MATIKIRDWVEPAHPVLVQRYDDLIEIYQIIKSKFQERIDATFDNVSRQIGFIVTTTLPVTFQIAGEGKIEKVEFTAKNLQGTVFENEFKPVFKQMSDGKTGKVAAGTYPLYLLWHDALKLKLRSDWLEPAHFRNYETEFTQAAAVDSLAAKLNPGVREPAHWFNASVSLDREEEILIAAIDEVYTDLKLGERVAVARRDTMKYIPGIREPAHFRAIIEDLIDARIARKPGPGVREPAHFRRFEELLEHVDAAELINELTAVMKKYGL